jgi:hypothetical protein
MSLVRTVQFVGSAYGDADVNLTATVDGIVVFDGNVVTKPVAEISVEPSAQYVLFTTTIPMFNYGNMPTTITVNSGDLLIFGKTMANYCLISGGPNVAASTGATGFLSTNTYGNETKLNVTIDDVPKTPPDPRPTGKEGSWYWQVPVNGTMSFSAIIDQGDAGDTP